jgi:hypothetical protein
VYSRAKSIQMSEAGHEVCIFTTSGLCASTAGAASPDAAAAPPISAPRRRNERRETVASGFVLRSVLHSSLEGFDGVLGS